MAALLLVLALQVPTPDEAELLLPGALSLFRDGPWLNEEERDEALGDLCLVQALLSPAGEERLRRARQAEPIYARLAASPGRWGLNPQQYRRLWKRTRALAEIDPDQLASFFSITDKRGYSPRWDSEPDGVSRWGWRDRFERLRPRR